MGSSAPTPSVTVMPSPTAPTIYKDVIPLQSYQQGGDFLKRIKEQTQQGREELYAQSGTPAQLGARKAGIDMQAAATYLSSLPKGDKYLEQATGVKDPYAGAREAATTRLSQAQADYASALQKSNEKPAAIDTSTPSWATSTIPEGMPGYTPPSPPPPPPSPAAAEPAYNPKIAAYRRMYGTGKPG